MSLGFLKLLSRPKVAKTSGNPNQLALCLINSTFFLRKKCSIINVVGSALFLSYYR